MNIHRILKNYIKANGWPQKPVRVGPGSCGTPCRQPHAYAEAVASPSFRRDEKPMYVFIFSRPCVYHDVGMKQRLEEQARAAKRNPR